MIIHIIRLFKRYGFKTNYWWKFRIVGTIRRIGLSIADERISTCPICAGMLKHNAETLFRCRNCDAEYSIKMLVEPYNFSTMEQKNEDKTNCKKQKEAGAGLLCPNN